MHTKLAGKSNNQVIDARPGRDCEALFGELIEQARAGRLVGAIVITLHAKALDPEPYGIRVAGWARTNPTYALGALASCCPLLQELALEHAGIVM